MTTSNDLFSEIYEHIINDERPSEFLNEIAKEPEFEKYPFNMLKKLKETKQSPKYHPEGSVWNHTMMVVDEAAKFKDMSRNKKAFMLAALLHDIGKYDTTKVRNGKITSYNHDKYGAELTRKFLNEFSEDNELIDNVVVLVRWHMQILFATNDLPFADLDRMKKEVDLREIALLGLCDRLGRLGADSVKEKNNIQTFLQKCGVDKEILVPLSRV
ncbi:MAG: HD domain-containing protein [Bacillota bacterium]|nr:HD domain-containing protein [Bacillota bacterium]